MARASLGLIGVTVADLIEIRDICALEFLVIPVS